MAMNRGNVKAIAVTPESRIYSHTRFIPIRRDSVIMNTTTAMATIVRSAERTQSTAVPNHAPA